jgi:undecaprenyl-diphosphatase
MAWECGAGEYQGGPMTLIQAFLLGIIQGLTEFIPVSSTGHLLITQSLLGSESGDATFAFLVLVQMGTIVSRFTFGKTFLPYQGVFAKPLSTKRTGWVVYHYCDNSCFVCRLLLNDAVEALFM